MDLSCQVQKETTVEEVNQVFKAAAEGPLQHILEYCTEPLVSRDFNGNAHSCIFDSTMTAVIDKYLVKAFGWYDNEWGYSNRVVDLIEYVAKRGLSTSSPAPTKATAVA